jgi:hypothetical protein
VARARSEAAAPRDGPWFYWSYRNARVRRVRSGQELPDYLSSFDRMRRAIVIAVARALAATDIADVVLDIHPAVQVRVIVHLNDSRVSAAAQHALAANRPGVSHHEIDGGHRAPKRDAPAYAALLLDLLRP